MKLRGLVLSGLLAALIAPAASAQGAGTVEFGIFAKKNWFGDSYGLADRTGGGLRLGFFPAKFVEIAASGAYTPTRYAFATGRVDQLNAAGELVFNVGLDPHAAMFFGGRYVYNKYFDRGNPIPGVSAKGHESGPGALVGFRFGVGSHLSVRVDGNVDFMGIVGDPNFALNSAPDTTDQHWGFSAGLAWMFGNTGAVGDADHDGVKDNIDQCPDTPRGVKVVKETGCPPVNQDSINAAKAAAEAAAAAKAREDSIAAAERARADSIAAAERARADSIAAAERAAAQAARDSAAMAAGLSAAQIQALRDSLAKLTSANAKVTLPGVNFATGTATLTQSSRFILDEVAATLNDNAGINVEVSGHTDNTGGRKLNERLSQQRADAVRNYLISKGVSGDRMTAKGYAWDRPVASNATKAGRALNRRTELDRTN